MIPYGRQDIRDADIEAVVAALRSDFLTQGPRVPAFEEAVAARVGAAHAVAVNSATSALHIACVALGLRCGDRLWTSPITFVASANCARHLGATVDFVDIDPSTFNMCPDALEAKLVCARDEGTLPKVVVPVAMCGQSCEMGRIAELAKEYGFRVLEDASHAIGASYRGGPVGDGRFADVTVFSFHPVKIITTAEGGLAVTNDADLARHMAELRTHGITRDPARMTREPDGPWYYEQLDLGFNFRMTDLHAALGLAQLDRLAEYVDARTARARRYDELLAGLPLTLPQQHPDTASSWHLYVIQLEGAAPLDHRSLFEALRADGIGVNLHYIPVHLQPYYRELGFGPGELPRAEAYYGRAISIPLFAQMTDEQQDAVVDALRRHLTGPDAR